MPSTCPKCRRVLEHDEICCAQVTYTWKCRSCNKLTSGFAIPYGRCFLCGGELAEMSGRNLGDAMAIPAIREAMQFELNAYHFYRMAQERTADPVHKAVLESMAHNELEHIHELEGKYHAHLDREVLELSPTFEKLTAERVFAGIDFAAPGGLRALYEQAIEMEKRTQAHFWNAAAQAAPGLERDLYLELAAEEEEHIALLRTEMQHIDEGER